MTTFLSPAGFKRRGKELLKWNDTVVIAGITYLVKDFSLANLFETGNDAKIFEFLGIKEKNKFCEEHYEYLPLNTEGALSKEEFPKAKKWDYPALTRLVVALMKLAEAKGIRCQKYYSTLGSLKGKTLQYGDTLSLGGILYGVQNNFLDNLEARNQSYKVFEVLEIQNKVKFCEKYYRYLPCSFLKVDFPQSRKCDFVSLTKVARALMRLTEKKDIRGAKLREIKIVDLNLPTKRILNSLQRRNIFDLKGVEDRLVNSGRVNSFMDIGGIGKKGQRDFNRVIEEKGYKIEQTKDKTIRLAEIL